MELRGNHHEDRSFCYEKKNYFCEKKKSNCAETANLGAIIYTLARFLQEQGKNNFCGDEIINI